MKNHIKVDKKSAEKEIRKLKVEEWIDYDYKIQDIGKYLLIPLKDNVNSEKLWTFEIVQESGIRNERRINPLRISGSYDTIGSIVVTKESDPVKLMQLSRNLLNSGKGIRSVYRDRGVRGKARLRDLELVLGEDNKKTLYKENGITLNVDISRAYFSPRLATERFLLANRVKDGEIIIDMFAGIGPFSILIASMRDVDIIAIDSNPEAISLLNDNIKINRLRGRIIPVIGDSALIMRNYPKADRIIMNFPTGAFQFIDAAVEQLKDGGRIDYYEIASYEEIAIRMDHFRDMGLIAEAKREVHAYSKSLRMFSIELLKKTANGMATIGQNNIRSLDKVK
ncbi:MAG: class I SAM-dependent methyltransferase family protein [Thermoplasmataceae archaeon]|jgi:tRNA (guanine37-N1)-methyltransferase